MTPFAAARLVARREIVEGLRSKAARISWLVTTALVIFVSLLPRLFGDDVTSQPGFDLALVSPAPGLGDALRRSAAGAGVVISARAVDRAEGRRLVAEGEVDAVLDGATVLTTGEVDSRLLAAVNQARAEVELAGRAARLSLTSQEVADLFAPLPPVDVRNLKRAEATGGQVGVATIAVVGLFLALTVYGGAVLNGVLTEKSSRVVEVLLASVQPQALLAGKVAGIGALGLLQVAAQAAVALAVLYSAGSVDLPSGTAATVVLAVVFFVLGFLLFSTFYATAGALVSRQEDAQAAATPVALLMTAAYIATIVVVLPAPSSVAARVLTFVPLTAPTTVLARTALSAIAWWEVALAAAVVVVASLGMIRVAARAYSGAVLSFGGRVKLREALRAGR